MNVYSETLTWINVLPYSFCLYLVEFRHEAAQAKVYFMQRCSGSFVIQFLESEIQVF